MFAKATSNDPRFTPSEITENTFQIFKCSPPTFTLDDNGIEASLTAEAGATIQFRQSPSSPWCNYVAGKPGHSPAYTDGSIRAKASKDRWDWVDSEEANFEFDKPTPCDPPAIAVAEEGDIGRVTLSCDNPKGAEIWFGKSRQELDECPLQYSEFTFPHVDVTIPGTTPVFAKATSNDPR